MAISFVAVTNAGGSSASATGNKPTGTAQNDLLYATVSSSSTGTFSAPTGWTQIDTVAPSSQTNTYWLLAGASEPSSYSWTVPNTDWTVSIEAYRGVDTVSPLDAHAAVNGGFASSVTVSLTTVAANCWIVGSWASQASGTITVDAAETSRGQVNSTSSFIVQATGDEGPVAAAAYSRTTTFGGSQNCQGFLVGLKPAATGGASLYPPFPPVQNAVYRM